MLVRIMEYNYGDTPMENGKFIAATTVEDFDKFLSMFKYMKGKDIKIENEWYTFEGDYLLNFPKTDEDLLSLDIYVCGY